MSIGSAGGSSPTFAATQLVALYALMSGAGGAASPELLSSLETAAQIADREATAPAVVSLSAAAGAAGGAERNAAAPSAGSRLPQTGPAAATVALSALSRISVHA
jgi:hypothetical protein